MVRRGLIAAMIAALVLGRGVARADHTHVLILPNGNCAILAADGNEKYLILPPVLFANNPNADADDAAGGLESLPLNRRHPLHVLVHLGVPGADGDIAVMGSARDPCAASGEFPCHKVDLLHYFTVDEIGGGRGSDVWGWEDPATGRDYVIAGRETGTSFIDITDPKRPVYLGDLPTSSPQIRIWRDIKVYANHAYIVTESTGHGMQVFDLRQLREVDRDEAPVTFTETARYTDLLTAHNIAINEDTGFLYAMSVREGISCNRGLHMIDVRNPANPTFAGCFEDSGAIHDTQCVTYEGPDARFQGRELCFNSSPDSPGLANAVSIVDVTDKSDPIMLARMPYGGSSFSHQGWLTEDQAHFLHGDEGDELDFGHPTRTLVWDVSNLTAPSVIGTYFASTPATDHNMYVKKRYLY